ncbi:MAG: hypothetical protein WCK53_14430, partial [Methanomicrobiales archaeon]
VLQEIEGLSVDTMTPLEALTWLNGLQKRVKQGDSRNHDKSRHVENTNKPGDSSFIGQADTSAGDRDSTGEGGQVNGGAP